MNKKVSVNVGVLFLMAAAVVATVMYYENKIKKMKQDNDAVKLTS